MKKLLLALVLATSELALASAGKAAGTPVVPCYFDPATRIFAAMVTKIPAAAPVARTGTVKISIAPSIESAIGTDAPISCQASISAFDASFDNSASASAVVTRSGAKGAVVLSIPYNWTMAAAGELMTISSSCSEGSGFTAGGVGHEISFTVPGFAVSARRAPHRLKA